MLTGGPGQGADQAGGEYSQGSRPGRRSGWEVSIHGGPGQGADQAER